MCVCSVARSLVGDVALTKETSAITLTWCMHLPQRQHDSPNAPCSIKHCFKSCLGVNALQLASGCWQGNWQGQWMAESVADGVAFVTSSGQVPFSGKRTHRRWQQQHARPIVPESFQLQGPPAAVPTFRAQHHGHGHLPFAALSLGWLPSVLLGRDGLRAAITHAYDTLDVDRSGSISLQDLETYATSHGLPVQYIQDFMASVLTHDDAQQPPKAMRSPQALDVASSNTPAAALVATTTCQICQPQIQTGSASESGSGSAEPTPLTSTTASTTNSNSTSRPSTHSVSEQPRQQPSSIDSDVFSNCQQSPVSWLLPWLSNSGSRTAVTVEVVPPRELTYDMFERFVRSREAALRRAFSMFDRDGDGVISLEDLEASLGHVAIFCPTSRCVYRCPRALAHSMLERTTATAGNEPGSYVDFASFRRFFMLLPKTDMAVEYWLRAGSVPSLTEKLAAVHEGEEHTSKAAAWGHLFAGAVAGATSRTATAPLETLRLAVMTGSIPNSNLVQAANSIVQAHGWQGLFRGNAVNVLRSAPQKALDFFAFDAFKKLLMGQPPSSSQTGSGSSALKTFTAAGLAGATSWALLYPLETVRSRITAGLTPAGAGVMQVARGLVATQGPMALYRGLGWSLAGIFPEAALTYGLHDLLKHVYRRSHQGREPGVMDSLSFGVLSAFTGQLVAFPLETIARRLQVHTGSGGLPEVLASILREGGPAALYKGVGAATLRLIPLAVISFGTYELVRSGLLALEDHAAIMSADTEYAQLHRFCSPLAASLVAGPNSQLSCQQGKGQLQACSLLPPCGISTHVCSSLKLDAYARSKGHGSQGDVDACVLVPAAGNAALGCSPCGAVVSPCSTVVPACSTVVPVHAVGSGTVAAAAVAAAAATGASCAGPIAPVAAKQACVVLTSSSESSTAAPLCAVSLSGRSR